MAEFRIETERLILRAWRESDIDPFMRRLNTPEGTRWLDGPKPRTHFVDIQVRMARTQAELGHSFWIIEDKTEQAVLGFCGPRLAGHPGTPVHGEVELGWRLCPSVWGQGYAREAAQAAIAWCWAHLPARNRLLAYTVPANEPSRRLMARLGMRRAPDMDFDHPAFADGHPLRRHITYVLERAQ